MFTRRILLKYGAFTLRTHRFSGSRSSGVARLGHTGVRALATRGRAPPEQVCVRIIGADSIVLDREINGNRTAQYQSLARSPHAERACPRHPKCFCTLCRISYKRAVPMLCPSIGDVLATPLTRNCSSHTLTGFCRDS